MRLKKIRIQNFKSFKDVEIEFEKFNVLVGPNASGKTNLVEFFSLLKKIYVKSEPFPFLDWWGYDNVVWNHQEKLPIIVKMFFELNNYNFSFETIFTGIGGKFEILKETLEIDNILTLEREGEEIRIRHNEEFFEKVWQKYSRKIQDFLKWHHFEKNKEDLINQTIKIVLPAHPLLSFSSGVFEYFQEISLGLVKYYSSLIKKEYDAFIIQPVIKVKRKVGNEEKEFTESLSFGLLNKFREFMLGSIYLKELNMKEIRTPKQPIKEFSLLEDGSNVINILHNLFLEENKIPERLASIISYIFPDTQLRFKLTEDGRILMNVWEKNLELKPPSISNGFYKVLVILTALELKPSILVIDEIENSLYAEVLEILIEELKNSESTVILTTHSPVVLDIIEPKDLIIVEKGEEGSIFRRIENPEELKEKLSQVGITLSEKWLYGKL